MLEQTLLFCACESKEHHILFNCDSDDNLVYASIHLAKHGFWKRLIAGLKYIFGYHCKYGHWEEFIIEEKQALKLREIANVVLSNDKKESQIISQNVKEKPRTLSEMFPPMNSSAGNFFYQEKYSPTPPPSVGNDVGIEHYLKHLNSDITLGSSPQDDSPSVGSQLSNEVTFGGGYFGGSGAGDSYDSSSTDSSSSGDDSFSE